ncbi:uncharacterized protein [Aegilops tauschii subsp. strangulata]|uniref:uncharacterized protein isoform X1 n=1 Tax=Aegilops tauschii subsp. strangulata TaxID=200361 RepID=UPI001ABCDC6C|nr:uncharacterized protein LOC120976426 [Aegilops tauschii subsp. strangulata]XP_040259329.1 uncharacterized protein LOC120976426 [Aegilops tauschii subsp. strangulata]XP_040259330.1 uncharacterized protein LOC120976426 [Aegilops tauschii subsp. strangulata]
MGRIMKGLGKGFSSACLEESDDLDGDPFVPNDFAEDDSFQASEEGSMDDPDFDKALYDFYVSHKANCLKRKITDVGARNVKRTRSSDFPVANTFARYSSKLFSTVIVGLSPRQVRVLQRYGADCLLKFVRTEVPLRFVKWLASKFDVRASVIQIRKTFIPICEYVTHDILGLPVDGEPIVSDADAGCEFILSHFNVTSIPPVSFFCNKLKSTSEELPDEDIFICFMCIALSTFLCPNPILVLCNSGVFTVIHDGFQCNY